MTPARRTTDVDFVADEDERRAGGGGRRTSSITKSPRHDRMITWGLLAVGSGAAALAPRSPDPAPQIEKLAMELRGVSVEMRSWRETVTGQLADIRQEVALVKYQMSKPEVTDDRLRKLEDRLLLIERK